jgi:hypothetical protein
MSASPMNNASADRARCANNGMSGHGTLPSRADGRMLAVDALPSSSCHTKGRIFAERDWRKQSDSRGLRRFCSCSAFRLWTSSSSRPVARHHRQFHPHRPHRSSYRHSVDGTQCGSGWYGPRSSLKRQIARFLNVQKDTKT